MLEALVSSILRDPSTLSNFPELSEEIINKIERQISVRETNSFRTITEIASVSEGLRYDSDTISLSEDWGVKLTSKNHYYIDRPESIRFNANEILISNNPVNSTIGCAVTDVNLNLNKMIGVFSNTPNLSLGQYSQVSDFNCSIRKNRYFIVSSNNNIVHTYNLKNGQYESSIGDGISGIPSTTDNHLSSPVSIDFGLSKTYILCSSGIPSGATGHGYVAVFKNDDTFDSIPIYCGKNGGQGHTYQGELVNPKYMFVEILGDQELLYVLNGFDEVGVFDARVNYAHINTYTIPREITNQNLGLSKISKDNNNLYITAKNLGKIIAIDLKTKKLVGTFGILSDESGTDSPQSLGKFNGLSGITVVNQQVFVVETVNNRVQSFGKSLITNNKFFVLFESVNIPPNCRLKSLSYDLAGSPISQVKIVVGTKEYDVSIAKEKRIQDFQVKIYIDPSEFSNIKTEYKIYPIYVLIEG
jgi:hypothetical protein